MLDKLKKGMSNHHIKDWLKESTLDVEPIMIPFGVFTLITYPLFYFLNIYLLAPQGYSSLTLRLLISLFCIIIILKNYWPEKIRSYLPIIWYGFLFLSMPFFATFMSLKNHFSAAWSLNALAFFILMILLVDWVTYTILLSTGIIFGTIAYVFLTPNAFPFSIDPTPLTFLDLLLTHIVVLIMGIIFSRNKRLVEDEKLRAMKSIGASIAHELRTPIASVNSGIGGIKRYLPKLLAGYDLAKNKNLPVPPIRSDHYELLFDLLDSIENELNDAQTIIDMLLLKISLNAQQSCFSECSIKYCVEEALRRYPFDTVEQKNLIHTNIFHDFKFRGENLLMTHILFNLLKNALYYIVDNGKGEIFIWTAQDLRSKSNILYFRDTAKGMSPHVRANLFKKFFTKTRNGTGLGLAFCKTVMDKFGGTIKCETQEGEYTEFSIHFPHLCSSAS